MKLRVARHTKDLEGMIRFYMLIPGMKVLGSFTDHDGYSGVFIGMEGIDWHLEFTVSEDGPDHRPDEDDLLVLYPSSAEAYKSCIGNLTSAGNNELKPKNPYWLNHGKLFTDPDGYGIMIVRPAEN